MDRGEDVLLDDLLGDEDGVLEVVAVPGHERDEHVATEGDLAALGARTVGQDLALLHRVTLGDQDLLVDAGGRVGAHELPDRVDPEAVFGGVLELLLALGDLAVLGDDDLAAGDAGHLAGLLGHDDGSGILGDAALETRGHQRRLGHQQRNALALHVGAHQRAVRVVVLQEGDQARGHRDELLRRHVHVVDLLGLDIDEVALATAGHAVAHEIALVVELRVGLRDDEALFTITGQVVELAGHAALLGLAVRGLDEPEVVDPGVGRQGGDQADVRTFRSLDRADAAVVRRMHVADLEAGTVAGETPGPEGRQAALVRQLGQRIDLVHELAELAATEEVAHHRRQGLRVDELLRRHRVEALIEQRHALLHQALGTGQAHTALVGQQLAHGSDAAAAQVVDVVDAPLPLLQAQQVLGGLEEVTTAEDAILAVVLEVQLLVDLVATHAAEIVALGIEEQALDQGLGVGGGRGIPGPEATIDVLEGLFGVLGRILLEALDDDAVVDRGVHDADLGDAEVGDLADDRLGQRLEGAGHHDATVDIEGVLDEDEILDLLDLLGLLHGDVLDRVEQLQDVAIAAQPVGRGLRIGVEAGLGEGEQRPEEGGRQELAAALLAVEVDVEQVAGVELGLVPGTAVGDDAEAVQRLAVGMLGGLEGQTRRTVQLADDDALGAIDHEGALGGHERDLAHEHLLLLGALLLLEEEGDVQRRAEGESFAEALEPVDLRLLDVVGVEVQDGLAVVALNREHLGEDRLQPQIPAFGRGQVGLKEFAIRVELDLDQVGGGDDFLDLAEVDSLGLFRCHCDLVTRGFLRHLPWDSFRRKRQYDELRRGVFQPLRNSSH